MRAREAGFTLLEILIVTGVIVLIAGAAGTFFLGGATPAVASAQRDIVAALDETRQTAIAFDTASLVVMPAPAGSGYRARVYARTPADADFRARNGPSYDSTVALAETAAPLGTPGFALTFDGHGNVTGLARFAPGAATYATFACPGTGAFALRLSDEHQVRTVDVPCRLDASAATPVAFSTPPAAATPVAVASPTCPSTAGCSRGVLLPPATPPTCPPQSTGSFPNCILLPVVPTPVPTGGSTSAPAPPSPQPSAIPTLVPGNCVAGPVDANGFASCIAGNPLHITGPAITKRGCGTHTPVNDPGAAFAVEVDIFENGSLWGAYRVSFTTGKGVWLDVADLPPDAVCGLTYTLAFHIDAIVPLGGNAQTTPSADTGDPAFAQQGVESILFAPLGGGWGSNS
jgi:type II secretory pathway pseudopilin PulG